jgi:hypothetical protein
MADEPLTVRGINWRQAFPFINLFRAFRVAVHPSKLVLALVALILLYVSGQVLDLFWAVDSRAVPQEVSLYEQFSAHPRPGQTFADLRQSRRADIEHAYAQELLQYKIEGKLESAERAAHDADDLGALKIKIRQRRDTEFADLTREWQTARGGNDNKPGSKKITGVDEIDRQYHNQARLIYAAASTEYLAASKIKNLGLFDVYSDYEANQVSNVVHAVRTWNWFGQEPATPQSFSTLSTMDEANGTASDASVSPGVIQSVVRFSSIGPMWLLTQHPLYFILFGAIFLVLWSIFGGAICRIAAVHVARDEKLSIRSALMFSGGKFLSFLFAPIIPLIIVVGIGLLVTAGSSLANIPCIGPIVVGALFILALAAGFLMALVLLGLIGGFNLMYPTVAVEGSDSFDAISRSFSYLYARPWRLGFYTIVSIVYGAAAFLFVRLFIWLMLVLTHTFAGMAIFTSAHSTAPLWNSLWANPATSARLSYDIDSINLDASQWIGARLIWLWVHLIIAILGAFVVCFYFSANTIIYYLLRREVDATDMDDVYLEQVDDEFADPIIADAPAAPPTAAGSPAAEASSATVAAETDIAPPT